MAGFSPACLDVYLRKGDPKINQRAQPTTNIQTTGLTARQFFSSVTQFSFLNIEIKLHITINLMCFTKTIARHLETVSHM